MEINKQKEGPSGRLDCLKAFSCCTFFGMYSIRSSWLKWNGNIFSH